MKMELIQPFINAADAVLAEALQCPTRIGDVAMDEEVYRRKGMASETDDMVRETVCELANLVIGNAVTALNDQGFAFKIQPPTIHTSEHGEKSSEDQEALVMCFDTDNGNVFMNIAMRYNRRRRADRPHA